MSQPEDKQLHSDPNGAQDNELAASSVRDAECETDSNDSCRSSRDKEDNNHDDDNEDEDEDDDSQDDEDEDLADLNRYWPPPINQTVELVGSYGRKTVSSLAFNRAGTRLAAGGHDHEVRIWDFQAIDRIRPSPIANSQPCGQTIIKNLDFSINDELILVISGGCQAAVVAKDGIVKSQYLCPKGDQYISDMANTKGHNQMLNDGSWNPRDRETFITCSNDGTVRIWDLNKLSQQKTVIKTRSPVSGLKALPSVARYSRDALTIVAGCNDGCILMWDTRRKFITTSASIKNAHLKGSEITCVDYSYSANKLCTRSEDESCKIWDIRQLRQPVATRSDLSTMHSLTDCTFSPDDSIVITGTSGTKQQPGQLLFLDAIEPNMSVKHAVDVEGASVVRSKWHPKINHISYSCSDGGLYVAYDKRRSLGGFLMESSSAFSQKRKKYVSQRAGADMQMPIGKIITPHALPMFRDDQGPAGKRLYKPSLPVSSSGVGVGLSVKPAGSTLSSYIAKNIAKPVDSAGLDIRQRLLRHAEETEKESKD